MKEGDALERLTRTIALFSTGVATAFAPVAAEARRATVAFGAAHQRVAEQIYLQHHRRLPGSLRKRRMKKKRRKKIKAWFEHYLEGMGAG